MEPGFETAIAAHVWDTRYRWFERDRPRDATLDDTHRRVARALAAIEADPPAWEARYLEALRGFGFLPGGRILAGAGTGHEVTLFNCFVMGLVPDDLEGIFRALTEGALTMQKGGGIGVDFSLLRPSGTINRATGTVASGPVSFLRIWDAACATILSTGARRGAMMATLRCDHPDVEAFVTAKHAPGALASFNLSVQVTDAFMAAVRADAEWPLVFPADGAREGPVVERVWSGASEPVPCRVVRTVRARDLWDGILGSTYDHAEPGVLFVDRIQREDNLGWRHRVTATNPCGEVPLQAYGACDLGSLNLVAFVRDAFTTGARLDLDALVGLVPVAVRMLDAVVDVSRYPLPQQAEQAHGTRRLGLGITGLGDALALLGLRYGSPEARALAADVMRRVRDAAYRASVALAEEKGPFPFLERDRYLATPFVHRLPDDVQEGIARHGVRNSHLLAIAPTGTISLLADDVSSGIEPIFALRTTRKVLDRDGTRRSFHLVPWSVRRWRERHGDAPLPDSIVTAYDLTPAEHLEMQAALQPFVDGAISKTINVPRDADFAAFRAVYDLAWDRGLKGCTTYRPNPVTGAVLEAGPPEDSCCSIDREGA